MIDQSLKLKPGKWLAVNCGSMPSDSNCQLVMLALEDQRDDLIDAGVKHAVSKHGHLNDEALRDGVADMVQVVEIN